MCGSTKLIFEIFHDSIPNPFQSLNSSASSVFTSGNDMKPYPTITIKTIMIEILWGMLNENILEIFGIFFLKIYPAKIITFEIISI